MVTNTSQGDSLVLTQELKHSAAVKEITNLVVLFYDVLEFWALYQQYLEEQF
jgi:hypothetical protein